MKQFMGVIRTCIFQTSDGLWHFQVYAERQFDIQVLRVITVNSLIEAQDVASVLQMHVDETKTLTHDSYIVA